MVVIEKGRVMRVYCVDIFPQGHSMHVIYHRHFYKN